MPIIVTITKAPESVSVTESTKTFDEQGCTLGRGKNNAWILDDPERFLSSSHCELSCENGQYYITDLSTNGTFFNGSVNPMGKGTKLPLNDGNIFVLGDYEFSVGIQSVMAGGQSDPFASEMLTGNMPVDDIFSTPLSNNDFGQNDSNPFASGVVSNSDPLFSTNAEETDPLAALDKVQGGSQNLSDNISGGLPGSSFGTDPFQTPPSNDPFGGPTHSDQADPMNQQISWPSSAPEQSTTGIPDDWDDDLMSPTPAPAQNINHSQSAVPSPGKPVSSSQPAFAPTTEAQLNDQVTSSNAQLDIQHAAAIIAQQQANDKINAELEILKQQINAQQSNVKSDTSTSVNTILIEAMGLDNKNLVDAEISQINQVVGEVVREMVSGLMQVLGSRSTIKNEFRMNVTTIQPVENNPLKFSANIDDALENMFIKQGNAYKKPVEAVKESFEGIAEHQVAILAGIRAAFKGVIERFDPTILEQRFSKQKKGSIIPVSQKAKNWELYLEYYNELSGDIDNSFQYLFGDEFVQAYEEQLQKLTIARKNKNK